MQDWLESLGLKKIRDTNTVINALKSIELSVFANKKCDEIDILSNIKIDFNSKKYEEKEKEIPEIIHNVLRKDSDTFTKLVKRNYFEQDAWLVSIECKELEQLEVNGHEVSSIIEAEPSIHFVKIHVPSIFIQTLAMPMIARSQ